ncbi:hypothetical protein IT157_08495 [bacterium]|jgi:hypothetical protein|nr:hypothetical protein [bacterium]
MSFSKTVTSSILLLAIAMLAWPAHAREWTVSPHRAQFASSDGFQQAPADETTAPVVTGKKNIGRGIMFSLIVPGTGQLYAGSWLRAIPWFAIEVAGWAMFAKYHGDGNDKTDEYEKYAGPWKNNDSDAGNFNYDAYMLREYQISQDLTYNTTLYDGDLSEWIEENWDLRQNFLDPPFGHDINTNDVQQYYEMIGKYYDQFGFGWVDTYDPAANLQDPNVGHIWGPSFGNDDIATIKFDGSSALFSTYVDMRGEANDLLETGNVMMEIVMINHILSALDAALTVRSHNKKLQSTLGSLELQYDIKNHNGAMARTMTLGIPVPSLLR